LEERQHDIDEFKARWFEVADIVVIKLTLVNPRLGNNQMFSRNAVQSAQFQYHDIDDDHYERHSPCFETSRRLSITSDGDVWCGQYLPEFFGSPLGNVKTQSLCEIWFGEAMNEFRREVRAGVFNRPCCRSCGAEIREHRRDSTKVLEQELTFS